MPGVIGSPAGERFLLLRVRTDLLQIFQIQKNAILLADPATTPAAGDLVCVDYRGLLLVGLFAGDLVLCPERPIRITEIDRVVGVIAECPMFACDPLKSRNRLR